MVIDLGSRSCGTPEDSFTDNVVYLLGRRNEGSFQSCHLLIGCGKYGSIWPAVSLYVRHTRVCVNIMRRRADRCVLFPRQVLYTDQQRVRTCVRPCVCVITLERRREGGGGGRAGLMYLGYRASRQTLHKQGVTAGEEGREGWRTEEVSHE